MKDKVEELKKEILEYTAHTQEDLENFRQKFISRKGVITDLMKGMKDIAPEIRKDVGILFNDVKNTAQERFQELIDKIDEQSNGSEQNSEIDFSLPPIPDTLGSEHPLNTVKSRIIEIFERIGFNLSEGPEVEDDWHNFTALNFPPNHPAREMQDTFFIEKDPDIALRTHTSSVQVRIMENQKPPIRTLSPGKVYRNEAISARAHCMFHQVEGLYIDKNVSFADLKQTLLHFVREFFGKDTKIRLRPSYFPFTEPSAEVDISCNICGGKGCNICKYTGYVEIGGCGMVDPNVLKSAGIDPEEYTGFAFGMGIERMAMLKYQINDLRLFTENDIRFLKQFSGIS
ncbi:phenylalanine--tRNA ligase subunit alpha [Aureibacter tunicatorum]|uniref:Phenylalanine--tRNA ligase alpha subunit n=1 Tax=Aureibacter tunicatorum TaxID=866807 RepID=A0AAE3XLK0_9BACT|nr:phenylalanine--tRNA ligase subunit alpha [Aureibacter tunicatorum]MDR6240141.1 phenylalanyl-tRNA synthetase alpha chain [Aureibacter tunicatorum]BDD05978.1 phenylalanine--tRNA ligase alpha subunit [Aureibacter tunicatorum]